MDDKRSPPSTDVPSTPPIAVTEKRTPPHPHHPPPPLPPPYPVHDEGKATLEVRNNPHYLKWICAFTCLISGTAAAYSFKIMNRQKSPPCEGCSKIAFEGAFLQTLAMFVAETFCLLLWFCDNLLSRRAGKYAFFDFVNHPSDLDRPKAKFWWWAFPCFFDFAATVLCNIALVVTYASTVQMLRNFMVVVGAVLQLVLVRKALRIHEYVGVTIITVAMVLAAIPAMQNPDDSSESSKSTGLGIALALIGTSLQAMMLATEDKMFRKGRYSPVKAVGLEGIYGIVYTLIAMPIADVAGLEPVWDSFYQWHKSGALIGITFGYMVVALLFNAFGLSTTKLATGLLRGVMFALRAPLVWLLDISLGWIDFDYYNLASVFVFLIGFACYAAIIRFPGSCGITWKKPIHYPCTRPELDDDYVKPIEDGEESNVPFVATSENV